MGLEKQKGMMSKNDSSISRNGESKDYRDKKFFSDNQ